MDRRLRVNVRSLSGKEYELQNKLVANTISTAIITETKTKLQSSLDKLHLISASHGRSRNNDKEQMETKNRFIRE